MKVEFAFLAEAADAQAGVFAVVRGGTDIWPVPPSTTFPAAIGPMSFVVRLSGDLDEIGKPVALRAVLVDADGRPLGFEATGEVTLGKHPLDRTRTNSALIHFKLSFQVPASGSYFFEVFQADTRLCQVPFWVVLSKPPKS